MTLDPDHNFGLQPFEDEDRLERILQQRSDGAYGVPALHGMLTASVVGPKPVPLDWILQTILSDPNFEEDGFADFPEFSWVAEKAEELSVRISRAFELNPAMFRLVVYRSNLGESETNPDLRLWCLGFVEAVKYQSENWEPLLTLKWGIVAIAPIFMVVDPDEWGANDDLNPYKEMSSSELRQRIERATQTMHSFWSVHQKNRFPIRASVTPGRNELCTCGSGRKFKRCCARK